jgi:Carboxypeptidase regulatory-like domain/TonB dependent receptor-like, beta-barrel
MITRKRRRLAWRFAVLISIALLSLNTPKFITLTAAQTTKATILGTVHDEQGNVVSKAKITAKNLDTGIPRDTTTDMEGRYRLSELPLGRYEISVQREGFRLVVQQGIELSVGREAVIDFKLNVGNVTEKVVINQDASLVDTTNSALGNLVNTRQIEQLPLNGRDVLQLATLENGVISTTGTTGLQSDVGPGTTRLAINGGRLEFNAFLLDGTETADAFGYSPGGLGGGFLGVDALREFQVLTSNYSAEFGHAGGAVINAVTKSGTNMIHGTAFEFLRNRELDARNFFDRNPNQLPFQRNQFGGSLGGPVIKDRAFLFGSFEGLRRRQGVPSIFSVPSPAAKQGNLTSGTVPVAPSVVPYLALYPNPNGPITGDTGIFTRNFKERTNEDFFTVRADYKLTGGQSLAARYTIDDSDLTKVGGLIQNLVLDNRNQYVSLEEQAIVGSRGVNSLRGTYNRSNFHSDYQFVDLNGNPVTLPASLGFIPGQRMGGFSIGGVAALRELLSDTRSFVLNQFEVNDQFIYNVGAHSIKIGGSVRRYQLNGDSATLRDGAFFFGQGGFAQFLSGRPDFLFATVPGTDFTRGIRQSLFSLYVQDDWRATRRLTLNLGLRYEPISTPTDNNGKVANLRNITDAAPTSGEPFIDNPSYTNVAPRVGLAYDVFGDGKTSLRAAAGVFYSAILPMRYRFEMSNQPPFAQLSVFIGGFPNAFTNPVFVVPAGVISPYQFDAEQPTVYQWNLNIQRELGRDLVLSAGYVGSRGVNLETRYSLNVRTDFQIVNGQKFFPVGVNGPKVNPNFSSLNLHDFSADSYYHALQLNLTKRFSYGLQFEAAYTLSKSIDTASATESVFSNGALGSFRQDPFDSRGQRGLSDFDTRNNFVANFLYDLPFGKGQRYGGSFDGVAGKLIGGWSTGGIVNLRSGFPFNVSLGFDRVGSGIDNPQYLRPNLAPGRKIEDAITGDPMAFVDPSFFQLQPAGFYGNSPRNALRGPNLKTFDMTLTKRTAINERFRTEFRFEAFNLFNRANFAPPNAVNRVIYTNVDANGNPVLNQTFGQLTNTAAFERQLQFGLKLLW